MMDKIKKLFNVKGWFEGVIFTKVLSKATKAAVAATLALLASDKAVAVIGKARPFLDEAGIEPEKVVVVAVTAIVAGLFNWAKRVMDK